MARCCRGWGDPSYLRAYCSLGHIVLWDPLELSLAALKALGLCSDVPLDVGGV